jgi:hypothetical protein
MANTRRRSKHVKDFYRKDKPHKTYRNSKQDGTTEPIKIETEEYSQREKFTPDYGRRIF